jgi:hypothetical protein
MVTGNLPPYVLLPKATHSLLKQRFVSRKPEWPESSKAFSNLAQSNPDACNALGIVLKKHYFLLEVAYIPQECSCLLPARSLICKDLSSRQTASGSST